MKNKQEPILVKSNSDSTKERLLKRQKINKILAVPTILLGLFYLSSLISLLQKDYKKSTPDNPINNLNTTENNNIAPLVEKDSFKTTDKPCLGNQECIYAVRQWCKELNYDIMGEEYLGDGVIGISAIDYSRPGMLWNIRFLTSCNCEILNTTIKRVRT